MNRSATLAVTMTKKEMIWGFPYLVLELFFLPSLLLDLNALLPAPLADSWLNVMYFSLNFIFCCFLFRDFLKRALAQVGQNPGTFLTATVAGFILYYVSNLLMSILIRLLAADYANLNDGNIAQQFSGNFVLMAVSTVVLVPVAEELLHRGLIFGSLYKANHLLAYIISATFFSAIHILGYWNSYSLPHLLLAFLQYLPAGLALAWAYRKSGSIFSSILIHATVNLLASLALR